MSRRTEKVSALLQQEVAMLINKLELPAITTVSRVDVASDLKHSKVWLTILTNDRKVEEGVLKELHDNIYDLQGEVNKKFEMRNIPRISFVLDESEKYADNINKLLKQTKEE
jgi:ribosome-binding factor A